MKDKVTYLKLTAILLLLLLALATVPMVLADEPKGTGPFDPLMVPTTGFKMAPGTTLWFYFDYATDVIGRKGGPSGPPPGGGGPPPGGGMPPGGPGGGAATRVTASVILDAHGIGGLTFAIYTPTQAQDWVRDSNTEPVGRGTPYKDTSSGLITHDLYWSGGFNSSGRYLIAVTNANRSQVEFTLTVTGDTVTLYPTVAPTPIPKHEMPAGLKMTPVLSGSLQGKVLFETGTGGEIYTVNGDGTNLKRLTNGIDPSWSPDGRQIVFARWDNTNPGVFIANADGSNERLVFASPKARWPQVSPDGQYVVFSQDKTQGDGKSTWKLGLAELSTGKQSEPQCSQLSYTPSWGKDSATVYYSDPDRAVMATNILKGPAWLIGPNARYWDSAANVSRPTTNWPAIQGMHVSPDGNRIVYAMQAHDRWEVNVMLADGSTATGLTTPGEYDYLFDTVVHNAAPTWSPDSRQILFLSDRNGTWEFFVMRADGTGLAHVLEAVTDRLALKFNYENEGMISWAR